MDGVRSGYGQVVGNPCGLVAAAPPTHSPDSLTGVLLQANDQLTGVEKRLHALLERLNPVPRDTTRSGGEVPVSGVLNSAMQARNTASRLHDVLNALEQVI